MDEATQFPLTRERYLALDFMGDPSEELGAEYKAMMPSLPSEADIIKRARAGTGQGQ